MVDLVAGTNAGAAPSQRLVRVAAAVQPEVYRFLRRALSGLRWATLAVLLLLTVMQPADGRMGLPTWALVLAFAAYNLAVDLLQRRLADLRVFAWMTFVDLPIAAVLYALGGEPGGPLFLLFVLAVDSAAASMGLRGTLLYTLAAMAVAGTLDLTMPLWTSSMEDLRRAGARLAMLGLVGVGMAIVTRRLTMEHESARRVQDEAGRIEQLDRLRAQFFSSVSHDLRTPLTAARAGLGLLETSARERLRPDEATLLENGRRNIERLNLLIDDLLAFNQLEAGALRLERESLDLREVVTEALAAVHPLVLEKEQSVEVDLPEPLTVEGDPRRLEQVIVNVLANAQRHTPRGTRIMLIGRAHADRVELRLADSGSGIPAAELDAIFGRFYRLAPADGGSGLGLAIARALVELHGGRIWAESDAGAGTTFTIALPRTQGEADV